MVVFIQPARAESARAVTGRRCSHSPHIICLVPRVFQPSFVDLGPKLGVLQKALCPPPKMAKIRPGDRKTARRTASYRKTEVIQSYLRMWGSYDPIESGPSEPKKWGLYGRSVKKCTFSGQKWAPAAALRPAVPRS